MIKLNSTLKVKSVKRSYTGGRHVQFETVPPVGDPQVRMVIETARGPMELPPASVADLDAIKPGMIFEVHLTPAGASNDGNSGGPIAAPGDHPEASDGHDTGRGG